MTELITAQFSVFQNRWTRSPEVCPIPILAMGLQLGYFYYVMDHFSLGVGAWYHDFSKIARCVEIICHFKIAKIKSYLFCRVNS